MEIDELYQTIILDHSRRPRNFGELPPPALKGAGYNPACGDEVVVFVARSPEGKIEQAKFVGQACAICMASTSLMTTRLKGKTVAEALSLKKAFIDFLTKVRCDSGLSCGSRRNTRDCNQGQQASCDLAAK